VLDIADQSKRDVIVYCLAMYYNIDIPKSNIEEEIHQNVIISYRRLGINPKTLYKDTADQYTKEEAFGMIESYILEHI